MNMELYLMLTATMLTVIGKAYTEESNLFFRLQNHILNRSNPMVRPVMDVSQPVHVAFYVSLYTIIALESTKQTLRTSIGIQLEWRDDIIRWNPEDFGNATRAHVSALEFWVPDAVVYNMIAADRTLDEIKKDFSAIVNYDGKVQWYYPLVLSTSCTLNMEDFPLDTQSCCLNVSTWTYNGLEVHLFTKNALVDKGRVSDNGEWNLINATLATHEFTYSCCSEPYYVVTIDLVLRRRELFYLVNIGLPTVLMLALSFVALLLPAESDSKLSLGVTIFLSQVFMLLVVTNYTPVQSLYQTFMTRYMVLLLAVMTTYLIVGVLIVWIREHAKTAVHAPRVLRLLFLNSFMICIFFPLRWRYHMIIRRKNDLLNGVERSHSRYFTELFLGKLKRLYGETNLAMVDDEADHANTPHPQAPPASNQHVATQTQPPVLIDDVTEIRTACHHSAERDILNLSDWTLLALMFERFTNIVLTAVTLAVFIWIGLILHTMPSNAYRSAHVSELF